MESAKIPFFDVESLVCGTLLQNQKPENVVVQPDDTVELPAESVPVSKFLSPRPKLISPNICTTCGART